MRPQASTEKTEVAVLEIKIIHKSCSCSVQNTALRQLSLWQPSLVLHNQGMTLVKEHNTYVIDINIFQNHFSPHTARVNSSISLGQGQVTLAMAFHYKLHMALQYSDHLGHNSQNQKYNEISIFTIAGVPRLSIPGLGEREKPLSIPVPADPVRLPSVLWPSTFLCQLQSRSDNTLTLMRYTNIIGPG